MRQRTIGEIAEIDFDSDFFSTRCYEVVVDGKPIRYVQSGRMAWKRVSSLFQKEPTTIPWLEAMAPGEVLFDIGGNVGMYSIYAAVMSGVRVLAFEPESLNFAELNKNIFVNHLHGQVTAYCLALGDENKVGDLLLGAFGYGYSHHDFEENTWTEDKAFGEKVTAKDRRLHQGCTSMRLDDLIASGAMPFPDHVKIDVDNLEHRVFAGARKTFADPRLKTVLIEVNYSDARNRAMIDEMIAMGWKFSWDQLRTNRKVVFRQQQIEEMQRKGSGGFNHIFFRDDRYHRIFADHLDGYVPPMAKPKA